MALSHSAAEKLAKLLLEWTAKNGEGAKQEPRIKLALTHEEIAQMIGTSRETVTVLCGNEEASNCSGQGFHFGHS